MEEESLISVELFCVHHNIEYSFIHSLEQYGLIEIVTMKNRGFIPESRVNELEKLVRLHYELDINLEGMDAITHLLQRVKNMQIEIAVLRNRLRIYEDEETP